MALPFIEESIVFRSKTLPPTTPFVSEKVAINELSFVSTDNAHLHGLHLKPTNPVGVILYFHGNKGNVATWQDWAEQMAIRTNHEVIMMDYRGYGKSTGERQFDAMLNDVSLFYAYAKKLYPADKIVIFGRSLGGAFASYCADKFPCRFLVLESTFTSLAEVVKHKTKVFSLEMILNFPFESLSKVKRQQSPVFVIHGDNDKLIPFQMGQQLFDAAPSDQKRFFKMPNGGHNDLHTRTDYWQAIDAIF